MRKRKTNAGYTLLEVVLVMAFVSISFMSLYGIFAKTIQGDTESRNEIIASNLAQECIERVRNCRDNQVLANPSVWRVTSLDADCRANGDLSFLSGGKTFASATTVAMSGSNAIVACRVNWNSSLQAGLGRTVVLKSLLSDWQKQ